MNLKRWIMLTLGLVAVISSAIYTGSTLSYFNDEQQSSENIAGIRWGLNDIIEGFESPDWTDNWTENGVPDWALSSSVIHSGSYSLSSNLSHKGYLTSNDIDAADSDNMTVSFWFYCAAPLQPGEFIVELFNGLTYDTWYDMTAYPGYTTG